MPVETVPVPIDPPPSRWEFTVEGTEAGTDIVGVGADLEPGTILAAYRAGIFPMPVDHDEGPLLAWWSPDPRAHLPLDSLRVSRSLRKSCARYDVTIDTAFEAVIDACAEPNRRGCWISPEIRDAYVQLHHLGWAHSVESWSRVSGDLAGGLYGIAIGGLFAGESMFHWESDASKVALVELVRVLRDGGATLLDVQWRTEHLASLGVVEVPREEYVRMVADAVRQRLPAMFDTAAARQRTAAD